MFITDGRSNYDAVLEELLPCLEGEASLPLFKEPCTVRRDGVFGRGRRLDTMGSILAVRYVLQGGNSEIRGIWVPYRDLKDGSQFAAYIKANIEDRVARAFEGKKGLLEERLRLLGGQPSNGEVMADLAVTLEPFPRIPLLTLFRDRDEEFPASFQFLFDASASDYLDLESLAVLLDYTYLKLIGEA